MLPLVTESLVLDTLRRLRMNSPRLGTGISKPLSVFWLGSPSLANHLLRLSAITSPLYQS